MTIWVSRVELSEARRHLLNLDDRTYSSGDWLARFVPTANICTAANDVHGAMIPITSSATKQLADYGDSPACMSAAQACLLFGPSRRLSMYAAINRRGLSNGLPSGFMSCRLPVCGGAASGEPQVMLPMRTSRPFQNKDCLCRTEGVLALEV